MGFGDGEGGGAQVEGRSWSKEGRVFSIGGYFYEGHDIVAALALLAKSRQNLFGERGLQITRNDEIDYLYPLLIHYQNLL